MPDQKEIEIVRKVIARTSYANDRNVRAIIAQLERRKLSVTHVMDVYTQMRNEGQLKKNATADEIRQILNEPQNWKYANQTTANEGEILRRYDKDADSMSIRDFLDFAVLNGQIPGRDSDEDPLEPLELPINSVWLNIYQTLQKTHWDYNVTCDASRFRLEKECQSRGVPFTLENFESAFQKLKDNFIKHNQEWQEVQEAERLRKELLTAYQEPLERILVGGHYQTRPRLQAHTPEFFEKERARLASLTLEQLRTEARAKAEATARAESEREEKQRLANLPHDELVQVANQGRQKFQQFEMISATYSPPGKPEVQIPWSTLLIKRLPSTEILKLSRRFGWDQINAAIQNAAKGN
jgi:hypothetical protein